MYFNISHVCYRTHMKSLKKIFSSLVIQKKPIKNLKELEFTVRYNFLLWRYFKTYNIFNKVNCGIKGINEYYINRDAIIRVLI